MGIVESDGRLDAICQELGRSNSGTLNALHACREGHPLGRGNIWKWRNANCLVRQHVNYPFLSFDQLDWLSQMAHEENVSQGRVMEAV
jgi:hypothetical protein